MSDRLFPSQPKYLIPYHVDIVLFKTKVLVRVLPTRRSKERPESSFHFLSVSLSPYLSGKPQDMAREQGRICDQNKKGSPKCSWPRIGARPKGWVPLFLLFPSAHPIFPPTISLPFQSLPKISMSRSTLSFPYPANISKDPIWGLKSVQMNIHTLYLDNLM